MKRKIIYRMSIFIFFISLVIIVYSIYEISSSKSKVSKNIETWDSNQLIKANESNNTTKEPFKVIIKAKSEDFEIMGKLTIVKTENVFPIIQGTTEEDLKNGAGHYLDSALPGENGNCVIFGHRDGVFKKLEDVKIGDTILVETSLGKFIYKITNLNITSPSESEIIKRYDEQMLTLVTCYPFNYIGSAPKRFVVIAKMQK